MLRKIRILGKLRTLKKLRIARIQTTKKEKSNVHFFQIIQIIFLQEIKRI